MALQGNQYHLGHPGGARATTSEPGGPRSVQVGARDIAPFMGGEETLGAPTLAEPTEAGPSLTAPQPVSPGSAVSGATTAPTPSQMLNNIADASQITGPEAIDARVPGRRITDMPVPGAIDPYAQPTHYATSTAGHLDALLQEDSPYMQRARTRAQQEANARGLLNTTMAATAGEAAAIDAALPIAQQDARQRQALQQMGFSFAGNVAGRYAEHVGAIQARASADINAIATAPGIDQNVKASLIENIQRQRDADLGLMDSIYEQMSAWNPNWTLMGGRTNRPGVEFIPSGATAPAPLAERFEPTPGGELPAVPGFEGAPGISEPGALPPLSEAGAVPGITATPGENAIPLAIGGIGAGLLADYLARAGGAGLARDAIEWVADQLQQTPGNLIERIGGIVSDFNWETASLDDLMSATGFVPGVGEITNAIPAGPTLMPITSIPGAAGSEAIGITNAIPETPTITGGGLENVTFGPEWGETGIAAGETAGGGMPGLPPGTSNLITGGLSGAGAITGGTGAIPAAASAQIASQGGSLAAGLSGASPAAAAAEISAAAPSAAAAAPTSWSSFLAGPGGAALGAAIPLLFPALGMALTSPWQDKWNAAFQGLQQFRVAAEVDPETGRSQFGTTGNIDHAYVIPLPGGGIVHAAAPPMEGYEQGRMDTFNYELEANGIAPWQTGYLPLLSHPGMVWDAVNARVMPYDQTPQGQRDAQWAAYEGGIANVPAPTGYRGGGQVPIWGDVPEGVGGFNEAGERVRFRPSGLYDEGRR